MKRKILEDLRDKDEIRRQAIEEQLRQQRAQRAQRTEGDGRPRVDDDPLLKALKSGKR